MSEIQNTQEPPPGHRRRKPGLAARDPRADSTTQATSADQGHYEECPQQRPTAHSEQVFTAPPSTRGLVSTIRAWLGWPAGNRVAGKLTTGLLVLCATGALTATIRDTPHPRRHPLPPLATQAAIPKALAPVTHYRRATAPHRPHRPASSFARSGYVRAPERVATQAGRPPQAVVRAPAPVVHGADTPSELADTPPPHGSGEEQTRGGPFSP